MEALGTQLLEFFRAIKRVSVYSDVETRSGKDPLHNDLMHLYTSFKVLIDHKSHPGSHEQQIDAKIAIQ